MGTGAAASPSPAGDGYGVRAALSVLGPGQVGGLSPRWARGRADPQLRLEGMAGPVGGRVCGHCEGVACHQGRVTVSLFGSPI